MKRQKSLLILTGIIILSFTADAQFWLSTQRLTWDSMDSESPVISLGSGNDVHIAWYSQFTSQWDIYYKKSTDNGNTWSAPNRLTWSSRFFENPDMCVDVLNRVFIAFADTSSGDSDVFYKKSEDGGATWQPLKRLTWTTGQTQKVSVASDSPGNTYMVYNDDTFGNYEVFLRKSTSGGAHWLPPQRLTWTAGDSKFPVLETSSATTLHVAWCESSTGHLNVFYKSSIDGGISWSPPRRLTWNALEAADPNITIDSNGHIYIVWYDWSSTNIDIFLKKSTDGGSTWSALQRVTWNSGYSCRPVIGTSPPAAIHLAWYDNTPGNYEIFYKKSTNGGAAWVINSRVTWSTENSFYPNMAVVTSNNQVHLTWQEILSPDSEIFYKKSQMIIIGENEK